LLLVNQKTIVTIKMAMAIQPMPMKIPLLITILIAYQSLFDYEISIQDKLVRQIGFEPTHHKGTVLQTAATLQLHRWRMFNYVWYGTLAE
jgi:hypothetical protein